ncbi:Nucleotidyltransferase [Sphingomonas antarctica]|uniref:Y-family DNA polymerase n=1 Tax=Sphingomonas antarctica TaxID=2040274 RepID=UPI0039EAE631
MTTANSVTRIFLALWLPYLSTERLIRDGAAPADKPFALVERHANAMRIAQVGEEAARLGLNTGTTLADARALLPQLVVQDDDPEEDIALLAWLADACDRYTPMVAINVRDGLTLDLTGCGPSEQIAADVLTRIAKLGLTARDGLGSTPEMAMARARYGIASVAALPVSALGIPASDQLALQRAGLKTVGAVAARPRGALAARFGAGLIDRLLRLTGEQDSRITPRRVPPTIFATRRFAEPVARIEDILTSLRDLIIETCDELARRGEGARSLRATLFRSDNDVRSLAVETGRPVRDPKAIAKLFDERIDALSDPLDPGFGYDVIRLDVEAAEPLASASPDLIGTCESCEPADALVDRLSTRLTPKRVSRLGPANTHIPEQAQLALPAVEERQPANFPAAELGEPPLRPLHLFDPPEQVKVTAAEIPDGPPAQFNWRRKPYRIVRSEGPERIAAEWWMRKGGELPGKGGLTRDYYRVEDVRGRRFWLFRHGLYSEKASPSWYIHGLLA